jgi:3-oxoadipate enol-lactonase
MPNEETMTNTNLVTTQSTAIEDLDFRYSDAPRLTVGDGSQLYVEDRGSGPPIVILNNFFMASPVWRSFTSRLVEKHRILTFDFRGQGGSTCASETATWQHHIEDLDAIVSGADAESVYLLGTSMSAVMCRDYALAWPEKVRGLILAGPALSPWGRRRGRRILKNWLKVLRTDGMPALFDEMYPLVFGDLMIETIGTSGYLGLRESFLILHTQEQIDATLSVSLAADTDPKLLKHLAVPTLLIVGDDDFGWSRSAVEAMGELISDLTAVEIPRAGHLPFLEATEDFENAVSLFVSETELRHG